MVLVYNCLLLFNFLYHSMKSKLPTVDLIGESIGVDETEFRRSCIMMEEYSPCLIFRASLMATNSLLLGW
jgi:hypothetical protein